MALTLTLRAAVTMFLAPQTNNSCYNNKLIIINMLLIINEYQSKQLRVLTDVLRILVSALAVFVCLQALTWH